MPENQKKGKGHTTSALQKIMFVILSIKLQMMLILQGRNISMEMLANWMFGRKTTCVETLNHNHEGIPTELKNKSEREDFSVTCHYESGNKDLCLLSYFVKTKSSGKKNVFLLSTMRPLNDITRDDNKQKSGI